jgi:hypothetical protein
MAALNRTFALEQMNDVAVVIRQNLDFDVPGALDEPFDVECAVPERRRRLATRLLDCGISAGSSRTSFMPMPPPPADGFRRTGKPTLRAAAAIAALD